MGRQQSANLADAGTFSPKFFNGIFEAAAHVGEHMYLATSYGHETRLQIA
jgi:hypothetical protein